MIERFTFTTARLDALSVSPSGRYSCNDSLLSGLSIRVGKAGKKTFSVSAWSPSKQQPIRVTIGSFPTVSIEAARRQARRILAQISEGADPNLQKRQNRAGETLGEVFAYLLDNHYKPRIRTSKRYTYLFEHYVSSLKSFPIRSIERRQIADLQTYVFRNSGAYTANRVIQLLKSIFNAASSAGLVEHNPVKGVKLFPELSRERFLESHELESFFSALSSESSAQFVGFILICLFTGARQGNVLEMRWEDIRWQEGEWEVTRTKNGYSQRVVLAKQALEVLKKLAPQTEGFVFPGNAPDTHMRVPRRQWYRVVQRAGCQGLRLHDLRRTFASWQINLGANLATVGKSLNHRSQAATHVYARLEMKAVRSAVSSATEAMGEVWKQQSKPW